ncbi:MAG: helix-turn-helix transcriptional regulator [Lentisphaerae bacterium]|nr:helix-turn-helix transcriptional regulator [Lentisphaerota bacterium]
MKEFFEKIVRLHEPVDLFNGKRLPKDFELPDNILLFFHDFPATSPNTHLRWTLVIPLGPMTYLLDEYPVKIQSGDVLIIPPGQIRFLLPDSKSFARLFITFELSGRPSYIPNNYLGKFSSSSQNILMNIMQNYEADRIESCSFELVRFIRSLENTSLPVDRAKISPVAAKAMSLINRYLDEPMNNVRIARKLNISESHLRMVFRKEVGMNISSYITLQRLNMARHLLVNSSLTIAEIAEKCGFRSIYAFSAFFRKKTALPPLRYRNGNRKSPVPGEMSG